MSFEQFVNNFACLKNSQNFSPKYSRISFSYTFEERILYFNSWTLIHSLNLPFFVLEKKVVTSIVEKKKKKKEWRRRKSRESSNRFDTVLGGDLSNWPCASLVSSTSSCSSYICFLRRFVDGDALSSSWETVVARVGYDLRSLAPSWISLSFFIRFSAYSPSYVAVAISRNAPQKRGTKGFRRRFFFIRCRRPLGFFSDAKGILELFLEKIIRLLQCFRLFWVYLLFIILVKI